MSSKHILKILATTFCGLPFQTFMFLQFPSFSSQGSFSSLLFRYYVYFLKVCKTVFIFFANNAKTNTKFCSYTVLLLGQVFLFGAVIYFQYPVKNGKVL